MIEFFSLVMLALIEFFLIKIDWYMNVLGRILLKSRKDRQTDGLTYGIFLKIKSLENIHRFIKKIIILDELKKVLILRKCYV